MAGFACLWEPRVFVPGIGRGVELRLVTIYAGGRCARELARFVARSALDRGVFSSQRETRQAVIELRTSPLRRRVASLALRRKVRGTMIWVLGGIICRHMTAGACRGCRGELTVHVTRGACGIRVGTHQRESRELRMVELRSLPMRAGMAGFTGDWEAGLRVVGV